MPYVEEKSASRSVGALGPEGAPYAGTAPANSPGMPDGCAALDVRSITVRYTADSRDAPTLANVSLHIDRGSITALVGPNGAGKTTLLKAICGRLPVASGDITLAGAGWRDANARRCLGVAPQRPALLDRLTSFENIVFFARQWGMPMRAAREAARNALRLMQLETYADRRAGRLSGGVRQRINIAAAIAHRPALVILDEPGAALDPQANDCIADVCMSLRADGFAILLTTHDLVQADRLADQVAIMSCGRLIDTAPPLALKEKWAPDGLAVRIEAAAGEIMLEAAGYREESAGVWRGRAASHRAVAEFATMLAEAGAGIASIEAHPPTLADAVAARLAAEPEVARSEP